MDTGKDILNKHYKTVVKHLIPSHVLPHLKMVDVLRLNDAVCEEIHNEENNKSAESASEILVKTLMTSKQEGWFSKFLEALENEGFEIIVKALKEKPIKNQNIFLTWRAKIFSEVSNLEVPDILIYLIETGCLSSHDHEEIQTKLDTKGNFHAMRTILHKLPKRKEDWFAALMYGIYKTSELSHYEDVAAKIDPRFTKLKNTELNDFISITDAVYAEHLQLHEESKDDLHTEDMAHTNECNTEVKCDDVDGSEANFTHNSENRNSEVWNSKRQEVIPKEKSSRSSPVDSLSYSFIKCNLGNKSLAKLSDIEVKITEFLKNCNEPVKTLVIAKAIGFSTGKEVNPFLYPLKSTGMIEQLPGNNWVMKKALCYEIPRDPQSGTDTLAAREQVYERESLVSEDSKKSYDSVDGNLAASSTAGQASKLGQNDGIQHSSPNNQLYFKHDNYSNAATNVFSSERENQTIKEVDVPSVTNDKDFPEDKYGNLSSIDKKIIQHLRNENTPVKVLSISKALDVSKKCVNSALYTLKKKGYVHHFDDQPPTWSLK